MKPLTKTVAIRRGGLAAQIDKAEPTTPTIACPVCAANAARHRKYMKLWMRKKRAKLKEANE